MKFSTLLLSAFALFLLTSCLEDEVEITREYYSAEELAVLRQWLDLPVDLYDYSLRLPSHIVQNHGARFPFVSNSKATLGRVLFYDKKLSATDAVSCASCHKQELAFSDDKALSVGFDGELTKRNSLALGAVANFETSYEGQSSLAAGFFWDERTHSLQQQSLESIQDPVEMGMPMSLLPEKLAREPYYPILFQKAYGEERITPDRITEALEEFMNAFVSVQSPFDEAMARRQGSLFVHFPGFTAQENRGKGLYLTHCGSCHSMDMTSLAARVANNGLDLVYADRGVGAVTGSAADHGVFKVPFLRNIALTAPYMHDGRFASLQEVVEHYDSGIQDHPNLDPRLRDPQTGEPKRLNLTEQEKEDLITFLHTLTDETFLQDVRFSDPFR